MKELMDRTDGDFEKLNRIIYQLLENNGPNKKKLEDFLKNYRALSQRVFSINLNFLVRGWVDGKAR